jgi:hypothetical protein
MLHRLPFKSIVLSVIVISAFILVAVLAFEGSMTIHAQTNGGTPSEPLATLAAAESPGSAKPRSLPQSSSKPVPTSEPGLAELSVQPQSLLAPQAAWPKYWYTVVGAVFLPANSDYSYQYGNSGCIKSNSPGYWRASVNLPDGSVAKYLYINYYNGMYSANSTAWLTKYRYNGDYDDLVSVNSRNYTTTNVGYFLDLSGEFTETIDNLQYGYVFIWNGSTTQRLCSVRLGYYPPSVFGVALPMIIKQP